MEARKLDKSSHAEDNYPDKIMKLSRMNYLQAQAFLTEYWKNELLLNEETKDHLTVLLLFLKLDIATDQRLRLIKAALLPLYQTCLTLIDAQESQHRPSMG
jgi:hypothetical protein